jgi:4-nitrophenol 2-monooxygenase / 4-nitrocatechol 4-monooxygenase, reductase component
MSDMPPVTADIPTRLDREVFRNVIGHFASGVTVITARHEGTDYGMTASAVSSLSLNPPMLLVCVNERNPTGAAISAAGAFAVNILAESQPELAERFGRPSHDKFSGLVRRYGRLGEPVLRDALAYLECRVQEEVTGGTHRVYLSRVEHAVAREGSPLTYFRGTFGRFLEAQDESLYAELRQLVLSRQMAVGGELDIERLGQQLNADRVAVYHALTRLSGEGMLERRPGGGYAVSAIDAHTLSVTTEARLAIELGVTELTVGTVSEQEVRTLRELAQETAAHVRDDRFVDRAAYLDANRRFHEHHIGLVRNDALMSAYRRLSLEGILVRAIRTEEHSSDAMVEDHLALVAAYETADLAAAKATVRGHAARSRDLCRRAIRAAGGAL